MGVNINDYETEQEFWEEFHPMLDFALARYLLDHKDSLPSTISLLDMAEYSNQKRKVTDRECPRCEQPLIVNGRIEVGTEERKVYFCKRCGYRTI